MSTGLFDKYHVTKADGSPVRSRVFVLKPDSDPLAVQALAYYAGLCDNEGDSDLADDIMSWLDNLARAQNQQIGGGSDE